jgi:uncharacterized protein (TIGR03382 family)
VSLSTDRIVGTRISTAGAVLDANPIAISEQAGTEEYPDVAAMGSTFVVTWQDRRSGPLDLYAARVTSAGVVQDAAGKAVSTDLGDQWVPAIACGASQCLVTWMDFRSTGATYAARLDSTATLLDATGVALPGAPKYGTAVTFDGTRYLVAWSEDVGGLDTVVMARVSTAGAVLDATPVAASTATVAQAFAAASFDGTNHLLVWEELRTGGPVIYGRRVSTGAVPQGTGQVPYSVVNQNYAGVRPRWQPAVAFDGVNLLVVFEEWINNDIIATRISRTGQVLDPAGINVSSSPAYGGTADVAWGGTHYMVVWLDGRSGVEQVYGGRVTTAGALLDPAGIAISPTANGIRPAVAAASGQYLVGWLTSGPGSNGNDLFAARLNASGVLLDGTPLTLAAGAYNQVDVAVTRVGSTFVASWSDSDGVLPRGLSARQVPLHPGAMQSVFPVGRSSQPQFSPAGAAAGSTEALVVWDDDFEIYGAFVRPNGTQGARLPLATGSGRRTLPSVATDGTQYLVVWQQVTGLDEDVYGVQVLPDGGTTPEFAIAASAAVEASPRVVAVGPERFFVAYNREDFSGANRSPSVVGRFVALNPLPEGSLCANATECGSGLCTGGVCVAPPDAGSDAGTDAGSDAGTDAGADAGTDAGADAGPDAGEDGGLDAGDDDAGTSDAGEPDAGDSDGGVVGPDGGPPELPDPRSYRVGCSCASADLTPWVFAAALALWPLRRRRR